LQDFDNDGRLSKNDLIRYLETVTTTLEGTEISLDEVADEILNELSTEDDRYITYESFQRVVAPTEFETRLRLAI
jgi:Ca2+-binding EF-hand superfamily protein